MRDDNPRPPLYVCQVCGNETENEGICQARDIHGKLCGGKLKEVEYTRSWAVSDN